MKTSRIVLSVAVILLSTFANASQLFLECSVENFENLKAIEIYESTKPGVAVELVETVLDRLGENDVLVTLPPSPRAVSYDDYYILNTCVQYTGCGLKRVNSTGAADWVIYACTDMHHGLGCTDYPVSCAVKPLKTYW